MQTTHDKRNKKNMLLFPYERLMVAAIYQAKSLNLDKINPVLEEYGFPALTPLALRSFKGIRLRGIPIPLCRSQLTENCYPHFLRRSLLHQTVVSKIIRVSKVRKRLQLSLYLRQPSLDDLCEGMRKVGIGLHREEIRYFKEMFFEINGSDDEILARTHQYLYGKLDFDEIADPERLRLRDMPLTELLPHVSRVIQENPGRLEEMLTAIQFRMMFQIDTGDSNREIGTLTQLTNVLLKCKSAFLQRVPKGYFFRRHRNLKG